MQAEAKARAGDCQGIGGVGRSGGGFFASERIQEQTRATLSAGERE